MPCLIVTLIAVEVAYPEAPPSPTKLNIREQYDGLYVPPSYFPAHFRLTSRWPENNPPRSSSMSEGFLWEIPMQFTGGKINEQSNCDDWIKVYISDMRLYPTAGDAKGYFDYIAYGYGCNRSLRIGDEARFKPWTERPWTQPKSERKGYDKDHAIEYRETYGYIRVGRIVFRIVIGGSLLIDTIYDSDGRFVAKRTVREAPSCGELEDILSQFAEGTRSYAAQMGWNRDAKVDRPAVTQGKAPAGKSSPKPQPPTTAQDTTAEVVTATGVPGTTPEGTGGKTDPMSDAAAAGAGAAAAGTLTAFGAWLMMRANGVGFKDLNEAYREWLRLGKPAPPVQGCDGEYNEQGEVWSDEERGWVDPRLYEQNRARHANLDAKAKADLRSGPSEDVKAAYDKWIDSKEKLEELKLQGRRWEAKTFLDNKLQELLYKEQKEGMDESRRIFLEDLDRRARAIEGMNDAEAIHALQGLAGIALHQKERGFKPTYTYADAIFDTTAQVAAIATDVVATKGIASASVNAAIAARTAVRQGEDMSGVVMAAGHSAVTDFVMGKAFGAVGKVAGKAWTWFRGAKDVVQEVVEAASPNAAARAALAREAEERAIAKLPPHHPARQIGVINEALSEAKGYDPRLITATRRLNPGDDAYSKAIEALKARAERGESYDKLLRPEAQKAMDAVRHDLDLRSRERALELLYKEHPECRGKITGFDNTGSHARKGLNYRGLNSDIDHTPRHAGTVEGVKAGEHFSAYQEKALRELTDNKLGAQDLKINCYGNNRGPGAFQSQTGLKVKDLYNQGSGRIDVVNGEKITHHLRGSDVVENGEWSRWSTGNAKGDARQVQSLCGDYLQKYEAERALMGSPAEELKQASKAYYNCRVFEAKSVGGRALDQDAALVEMARDIKAASAGLSDAEKAVLAKKFLDELQSSAAGS